MAKTDLTAQRLRELLDYDQQTGVFTWRVIRKGVNLNRVAGHYGKDGYGRICIDHQMHTAHRLAWLYTYDAWPEHTIDHIDGDPSNNRLANLREATQGQNNQNIRGPNRRATSGLLGACWHKATGKWRSQIMVDRQTRALGYFATAEEAHAAYLEAKRRLHPFNTI